jgi:hypothetical protein
MGKCRNNKKSPIGNDQPNKANNTNNYKKIYAFWQVYQIGYKKIPY